MDCESCGMPMDTEEDHGGGDEGNKYCQYCCDEEGNLKSREAVRNGWINSLEQEGMDREEAEKKVDQEMKKMPAWKE